MVDTGDSEVSDVQSLVLDIESIKARLTSEEIVEESKDVKDTSASSISSLSKNTESTVSVTSPENYKNVSDVSATQTSVAGNVKDVEIPDNSNEDNEEEEKKQEPQSLLNRRNIVPTAIIKTVKILEDAQDNPYLELNWKLLKKGNRNRKLIRGFKIYRRRLSKNELQKTFAFSREAFDKFCHKIIKKGKFSEERKAVSFVRPSSIPLGVLNFRLNEAEQNAASSQIVPLPNNSEANARFPKDIHAGEKPIIKRPARRRPKNRFIRIAAVAAGKVFVPLKKVKIAAPTSDVDQGEVSSAGTVSIKPITVDENYDHFRFKDKSVRYGEGYEYFIVTVPRRNFKTTRSEVIKITVIDFTSVFSKYKLRAKQIDENRVGLALRVRPRDKIENFHIYRREKNELSFRKLAIIKNINDSLRVIDRTVKYQKSYIYRVFLKNVFERISRPIGVDITSTVKKITPYSQSNNLRIPVFMAVQDQNSDSVKVTISPNDTRIFYYKLDRRDLTIHEKKFSKPGRSPGELPGNSPLYGGDGWDDDKFLVEKTADVNEGLVKLKEIVFIDDTVSIGHIYQYRVRGYDLFNNPTSYALKIIRVLGKKSIHKPINVKSDVLQGFPLRVRISWDDDNATEEFATERQFNGEEAEAVFYKVQRRKKDQQVYETFPLTSDRFLIDEAVEEEDIDIRSVQIRNRGIGVVGGRGVPVRAKGLPPFLLPNDIYYYRIAAVAPNGEESNFTDEFELQTLQPLLPPVNVVGAVNVKIRPLIAEIRWRISPNSSKPDFVQVDRKEQGVKNKFQTIGRSYIKNIFFDDKLKSGKTYIYRVTAMDVLGRRSRPVVMKMTVKGEIE